MQNLGLNINKNGNEQALLEEEPKSAKTISHNDLEDKSITISQPLTSNSVLFEQVPNVSRSRKSNAVENSLEIESIMNKENTTGNI